MWVILFFRGWEEEKDLVKEMEKLALRRAGEVLRGGSVVLC